MKVDLVRIGNSRGLRIPKALIDQCGFEDAVDLRVEDGRLVIAPNRPTRQGWREAFRSAPAAGAQELLLEGALSNPFDREEWEW